MTEPAKPVELAQATENPSTDGQTAVLLLIVLLLVITLAFVPPAYRALTALRLPDARLSLGPLQRISFVNGCGKRTQIDTPTHSLLLAGVALFPLGAQLEQRSSSKGLQVCAMGTAQCLDQITE